MSGQSKIISLDQATDAVRKTQLAGRTVVLCHGCFDIVHPGHIRHLQQAAKFGDCLLVTITGDALIDKGSGRPLIPQELRAENLAALGCVTWVAISSHPTAADLLDRIRPDVYVKGREYEHNRDPRFQLERAIVERNGGRVVFTSGDVVFSSTALINALEESTEFASPFQSSLRKLVTQHHISSEAVNPIVDSFRGKRVLVIGEVIVDTYIMCDRPSVAGESPMLTLRPLEKRSFDGGAAIIAKHLAAMGAEATLVTAWPKAASSPIQVGKHARDDSAQMASRLHECEVGMHCIEAEFEPLEKQRFLVGTTKVMKLDLGGPITLDLSRQQRIIDQAVQVAKSRAIDAAIIVDFGQGLFTQTMLEQLCAALRPTVQIMAADISGRRSNLLAMRSMDLLCPSEAELRDAFHDHDEGLSSVTWRLLNRTQSRSAIVTLGADGLIAFDRTKGSDADQADWRTRLIAQHVPALAPYAVDQLGCGDSMLAAATLTLTTGASTAMAAVIGSVAASAQSQRLGNAVVGAGELRRGIRRLCDSQLVCISDSPLSHSEPHSKLLHQSAHRQAAVLGQV